ncbi:hypothetical protein [Plesiomonas shigelloides]|uniref:hypothetical protein n=1 Tax=Plesiomonas shigelloides TaxID=703 RepID=UPI0022462792|nr:hypothetical protein [Plesiomonas shigelloides]MCX2499544.1 hypothetical protein [Plesiomonas shigelloides]
MSFPNGEYSVSELELEVNRRDIEGTIHGLAPYSSSIVDTFAVIALGILSDLGFEFECPKEVVEELANNSGKCINNQISATASPQCGRGEVKQGTK